MARRQRKNQFEQTILLLIGFGLVTWVIGQSFASDMEVEGLVFVLFVLVIMAVFFGVSILVAIERLKRRKLRALSVSEIDVMSGVEFERYVGELLKFQGYKISFTKTSGDYGVDIIAHKNSERNAVQVKRYKKFVGRSAISDAVAGMAYYGCTSCMVVTNSIFTRGAIELAKSNNCTLVDRNKLTDWILAFSQRKN